MKKILLSLVALLATLSASAGEITLWEGEAIVEGWANQPMFLSDTGTELKNADATIEDFVRFYVESYDEDWQVQIVEGHWGGTYAHYAGSALVDENTGEPINNVVVDLAATPYIELKLTQEILDAAYTQQWWGGVFLLNGTGNMKFTKMTLVKEGDIPTWEETGKALTFDEYGNILASEFNGYTDDAKIEFVYQTEGAGSFVGWGAGSLKSIDTTIDTGIGFPVKGDGQATMSCKLKDIKEALNAGPDEYGRYGVAWGMWDFGEGSCKNSRISATIYELVGATGEKYVAPGASATNVYVIGNIEGTSWDSESDAVKLAYDAANDVYTGTFTVQDSWEGNGWFAFGTTLGTWDEFNADRYTVASDYGTLNETATLVKGVDQSFKLPVGTYSVTISLTNMTIIITAGGDDSISGVAASATPVAYYSLSGARLAAPVKGVNIVKMSDNKIRKVLVK